MSDELPNKKHVADVEFASARIRQGFWWGITNNFAGAAIPMIIISVVMGFVLAVCVTGFEWSWGIVR